MAIREILTGEETPAQKTENSPIVRAPQKAIFVTPKTQIKQISMLPRIQRLGDHSPTIKITKKANERSTALLNVACSTSGLAPILPQPAGSDRHASLRRPKEPMPLRYLTLGSKINPISVQETSQREDQFVPRHKVLKRPRYLQMRNQPKADTTKLHGLIPMGDESTVNMNHLLDAKLAGQNQITLFRMQSCESLELVQP